jgi:hypothetical protein
MFLLLLYCLFQKHAAKSPTYSYPTNRFTGNWIRVDVATHKAQGIHPSASSLDGPRGLGEGRSALCDCCRRGTACDKIAGATAIVFIYTKRIQEMIGMRTLLYPDAPEDLKRYYFYDFIGWRHACENLCVCVMNCVQTHACDLCVWTFKMR